MGREKVNVDQFLGSKVPGFPEYTISRHVGSGLCGAVFTARSDTLAQEVACKVIPEANLESSAANPSAWREEFMKANKVGPPLAVQVFQANHDTGPDGGKYLFVVSELVNGVSLRQYLKERSGPLEISIVVEFLKGALSLLYEMERVGVTHGDLHEGNVLVQEVEAIGGGIERRFRFTDFGVARATSETPLQDDYDKVSAVLETLLRQVSFQDLADAEQRYVYRVLNEEYLGRHLMERDPTRDDLARSPRRLYQKLVALPRYFEAMERTLAAAELTTPFDYLSCEQMGDNHGLLRALYSDRFLRLGEIESHTNLVVTGPRGCGKTTVFRSMSLAHRLHVGAADPEMMAFIGVYFRCQDMYFAFPRYKAPGRAEAVDLPVHYLTCALIVQLLRSLWKWLGEWYADELKENGEAALQAVREVVSAAISKEVRGTTLEGLLEFLQREQLRAKNKQRFADDPKMKFGTYFGPEVLGLACEALASTLPCLRSRPIYFFIDDYSSPKISSELQRSVNRLVLERMPHCFFKISTESPVSFENRDIDGKTFVEGREFTLVNLGTGYIQADSAEKVPFIADVLQRRFEASKGYPLGSFDGLVDPVEQISFNEEARRIRDKKKIEYAGVEALANLCSGDVHHIISLVKVMVDKAGGAEEVSRRGQKPAIQPSVQNEAIRSEAGQFLKNLRSVPERGDHLVQVVNTFGKIAKEYLKTRNSKNEMGAPPHQATRIELRTDVNLESADSGVYEVYRDLLRYSVFIEDVRGKSVRGDVVPRLYLRRFLVPHFNLTFNLRDSVGLEPREFVALLSNPKGFEVEHLRKIRKAKGDEGVFETAGDE